MDGEEWQWRLDPVMLNLPVAVPLLSESFNTGLVIPKPRQVLSYLLEGTGSQGSPRPSPVRTQGATGERPAL